MRNIIILSVLIITISFIQSESGFTNDHTKNDFRENPARYIEVVDWKFYVASRVAILYNVTLENKSPVTYGRVKVRVNYYSRSGSIAGKKISQQAAVLNIELPPNSKMTYLKRGYPIGAGSNDFLVKNLEILSADAISD